MALSKAIVNLTVLQFLFLGTFAVSTTKVAIVTGSNKGIGFGTVRGLCKNFDGDVFLTSRNVERGLQAVEDLRKEGLNPQYHQLDVTDRKSIEDFRDFILANYTGIDVLVNNAGILMKGYESAAVQAERTINGNFFSVLLTSNILFPILKNGAHVVNVMSDLGTLYNIPSSELRTRLGNPLLTEEELTNIMQEYVNDAKIGNQTAAWGASSYRVSKVGVGALTMIQQRTQRNRGIIVNAVNPGWVNTDMSDHYGYLSIDQGAESSIYAALNATQSLVNRYIDSSLRVLRWK